MRPSTKDQQMRLRLAQEAARIIEEEGIRDFHSAKRKAAAHLAATDTRNMPSNTEIEQALIEYQRLFKSTTQPNRLRELREAARHALRFFTRFHPRLVGSVLSGTANAHSDVNLHLFTDVPEDVAVFLMQEGIPYDTGERRLRLSSGDSANYPVYRFLAGDTRLDLTVFPIDGERQAPRSPVDGKPMRRAGLAAVEELLKDNEEHL
jgi:hypothetical protein